MFKVLNAVGIHVQIDLTVETKSLIALGFGPVFHCVCNSDSLWAQCYIICYKVHVSRHKVAKSWLVKISLLNLEICSLLQSSVSAISNLDLINFTLLLIINILVLCS